MSGPGAQGRPGFDPAQAQIVSVEGDRRGGEMTLRLSVTRGGQPVEVWCRQQVPASYAAHLEPGRTVDVLVDQRDPRWAWLDLEGRGAAQQGDAYQQQLAAYQAANKEVPARDYVPPPQVPGFRPGGQPGHPGQPYPGGGYPGGGWGAGAGGDPRLMPVEGVGFDLLVQLTAEQLAHPMAPEQFDRLTYARGVPPGRWAAIQAAWNQRFAQFPDVGMRFQQQVTQAVGRMSGARGTPPPTAPPGWSGTLGPGQSVPL